MLRFAFDNWLSRAYLLGVVAVAGWVFWTLSRNPDTNFAAVWLIFVTLPFSFLGVWGAGTAVGEVLFFAAIVLGALVNAMALGSLVALVRRGRAQRPS
jgi:hypothetical protein